MLRRLLPRIPGTIVALVGGTAVVVLAALPVETIGTRFGGIPVGSAAAHGARASAPTLILTLLRPALTVAMLGAIESLMSAVVADRMSGDRHNPNVELVAQGIANIASPLFGGLPATGAIARTATNIRSGARTPVAGMVHALTLLVILLVAAPLARYIPLAVLAAILLVVAYNMGEWHEIPSCCKLTKTDISVWLVTFALTVFADLTVAVEVGMVLAALLFIRRVAGTTTVSQVTPDYVEDGPGPQPAGQADPDLTWRSSASTGRSCSARPTSSRAVRRRPRRAAADRHPPAAEHDGDRRDRAARARGPRRALARVGPDAAALRRARAARRGDAGGRLPRSRRRRRTVCANIESALARARQLHEQTLSPTA